MSANHDALIRLRASEPTTLFQQALDRLCPPASVLGGEETYILGFAVTAADPASLLAACVREVAAIVADEGSQLRACDVSGVMRTDEGQRAWGFVSLAPGSYVPLPAIEIVSIAQVPGVGWEAVLRGDGGGA